MMQQSHNQGLTQARNESSGAERNPRKSLRQMLHNPIVFSECKVKMRSWRAPIGILIYVGCLTVFLLILLSLTNNRSYYFNDYSETGRLVFMVLSIAQFFIMIFIAPGATSGAISSEREKQTLDLLLCTQMRPVKIVLGKLISAVGWVLLLLICTIPLYSITFLYGGVSPQAIVLVMLFLVVTAIVCGSVGLFYSTVFRRTVTSSIISYLTLLFIGIGSFIAAAVQAYLYFTRGSGGMFYNMDFIPAGYYLNPFVALFTLISLLIGSEQGIFFEMLNIQVSNRYAYLYIGVDVLLMLALSVLLIFLSVKMIDPIKSRSRGMRRKSRRGGHM